MICFLSESREFCYEEDGIPKLAFAASLQMNGEKMSRPLHVYDNIPVLHLVRSGRVHAMLGARRLVAEQGQMILVRAGVVSDLRGDGEAEVLSVGIRGLRLVGLPPDTVIDEETECFLPAGSHSAELEVLFQMIFQQVSSGDEDAALLCAAALSVLVLRVRQLSKGRMAPPGEEHHLAGHIRTYLDAHYAENISLGLLAERFYVSPYYASHVFKEAMGYSPIQYVGRRRIGEAQTLLIMTDGSVTQIADKVGFDNPNYFSTAFTKLVGLSPQRYRQAMRGGE